MSKRSTWMSMWVRFTFTILLYFTFYFYTIQYQHSSQHEKPYKTVITAFKIMQVLLGITQRATIPSSGIYSLSTLTSNLGPPIFWMITLPTSQRSVIPSRRRSKLLKELTSLLEAGRIMMIGQSILLYLFKSILF